MARGTHKKKTCARTEYSYPRFALAEKCGGDVPKMWCSGGAVVVVVSIGGVDF